MIELCFVSPLLTGCAKFGAQRDLSAEGVEPQEHRTVNDALISDHLCDLRCINSKDSVKLFSKDILSLLSFSVFWSLSFVSYCVITDYLSHRLQINNCTYSFYAEKPSLVSWQDVLWEDKPSSVLLCLSAEFPLLLCYSSDLFCQGSVFWLTVVSVFTARHVCIAWTMPSQDVHLSVCLSLVCHTPVLSLNGYTYLQSFFTVG